MVAYKRIALAILQVIIGLACFYFCFCSLDLLSSSFRLLGSGSSRKWLTSGEYVNIPAMMMLGLSGAMIVQSSSAFTAIVVAAIGAGRLEMKAATPIIMGANVGTTITNTLVSTFHLQDREKLRRAVGVSCMHDLFNWFTLLIFLPLEFLTEKFSGEGMLHGLVRLIEPDGQTAPYTGSGLLTLTNPLCHLIVQVTTECPADTTSPCVHNSSAFAPDKTGLGPNAVGGIVLPISIVLLGLSFYGLVRILRILLESLIKPKLESLLNADFDSYWKKYLHGYFLLLVGSGITLVFQSSSVITSTFVPMAANDLIRAESIYPMYCGANLGTTVTIFLAAWVTATDAQTAALTFQAAWVHFFFNLFGILIFYPAPFLRLPYFLGRQLGNTVNEYRWFLSVYTIGMYIIMPLFFMSLSYIDESGISTSVILSLGIFLFACHSLVGFMRSRASLRKCLPKILWNGDLLPIWMRSLAPYDRFFKSPSFCSCCKKRNYEVNSPEATHPVQMEMNETNENNAV